MNMYDVMYEAICDQYENGEITLEEVEILNDTAYDKYVVETSRETKAKRDRLYYGPNSVPDKYDSFQKPRSKKYIRRQSHLDQDTREFDNYYHYGQYNAPTGKLLERIIPNGYMIYNGKRENIGGVGSSLKLLKKRDKNGNIHEYYAYTDKFPNSKYSERKKEILDKHNADKKYENIDVYTIKKAKRK